MCAVCDAWCAERHDPKWDWRLRLSDKARRQPRDWRGRFKKEVAPRETDQ